MTEELLDGGYVQGAADDHENWAQGLTPELFWEHKDELLDADESMLPQMIAEILDASRHYESPLTHAVQVGMNLYVGNLSVGLHGQGYDAIITCNDTIYPPFSVPKDESPPKVLHFQCPNGKLGSRSLRTHLPRLPEFISNLQSPPDGSPLKILCACPTGTDLSVGIALAMLCLYQDPENDVQIDKTVVHRRLAEIIIAHPSANPSRSTLQSVNAFLMPGIS